MWSVTIAKELRDRETDLLNGVNVWKVCRYIDGGNVDSPPRLGKKFVVMWAFLGTIYRKRNNVGNRENDFRE